MFKFDFSENVNSLNENELRVFGRDKDDCLTWEICKEIVPDINTIITPEKWKTLSVKSYTLYYTSSSEIGNCKSDVKYNSSADIIPAKYEGGLKVWDCTYHLANLMTSERESVWLNFKDKSVLDLGCGSGLLGILAFKLGASSVHFQDYNDCVINAVTIPSVLKNLESFNLSSTCKYFSGDWLSFSELTKNNSRYHCILTSATIYNVKNYHKLLEVFKRKLHKNGVILLAAKTYYFGNGGGTRQFEEVISHDGTFSSVVVWSTSEGVQHEILKITFKNP